MREKLGGCADALALRRRRTSSASPPTSTKLERQAGQDQGAAGPAVAAFIEAHDAWLAALRGPPRGAAVPPRARAARRCTPTRYEARKRGESALDFEDLELLARDLLRDRPDVRAAWSERFVHVMVDEYQDTNPLQDELIDLIAAGRLFAVGDDRQSIYGFRHADVEGFRERRAAAEAAGRAARLTYELPQRRRRCSRSSTTRSRACGRTSTTPLAAGADADADAGGGPSVELLVVDRDEGALGGALGERPVRRRRCTAITAWRAAEARLLAARIDELVRGARPASATATSRS